MRKLLKTCIPQQPVEYKTYTIKRHETATPAQFFSGYYDDAGELYQGDSAFDEFFGYRPVLLNSAGEVTAELNPNNFEEDVDGNTVNITNGDNVMIEFPLRGIKLSKEDNEVTLSITDNPDAESEGFQYFAHSRGTFANPIKKDKFYLGAYKGFYAGSTSALMSWSGHSVTTYTNLSDIIDAARANDDNTGDSGYDLQGFYQRMYIIALYMMKYGNPNVQSVVGMGFVSSSSAPSGTNPTGLTKAIGMTGSTNATSLTGRVKLFGLEDLWGYYHERVGGYKSTSNYHVATTLSNFNTTGTGFTAQDAQLATNRQNYEVTAVAGDNYSMFMPTENINNTAYNTYYCDNTQILDDRWGYWGASYNQGSAAGLFRFYTGLSSPTNAGAVCGRIMYL